MSEQVLITGAGSGLGSEFVKLALEDEARVFAVSLLEKELEELRDRHASVSDRLVTHAQDLSKLDAAENLANWCDSEGLQIGVLINNAGYAVYGDVVDLDLGRVENMMLLNMLTVTKLSALFGAKMKERGAGNILNVGSTTGMVPAARFAVYGGSKAYVNSFTVALREELAGSGVSVTLLTPGAVQTNFAAAAEIDKFGGKSMMKDMFSKGGASSPQMVAAAAYKGMRAGKAHVLVGKGASISALVPRLAPFAMVPRFIKNI